MIEVKTEETETSSEETSEIKPDEDTATNAAAPETPPPPQSTATQQLEPQQPPPLSLNDQNYSEVTLNPLNEPENNIDAEAKTKHRRYWTPKEEEKFFEVWGRENWRLTKHGKNTIFFAKWSDEMRDRFNIDVKPEEVQCKVNQTRAKFRQVKKMMETNRHAVTWKKYDLVEKILKNQYRSKDDDPVPPEAIENNRDYSPTELLNCATQPCSPSSISNISNIPEQNINLSQSLNEDHQLTDEVNMSAASLSDHNLFSNNSQTGTSFSTELFGSDQLELKENIENEIKREGFTDLSATDVSAIDIMVNNDNKSAEQTTVDNQLTTQQPSFLPQHVPLIENNTNMEHMQMNNNSIPNSMQIQNRFIPNHNGNNTVAAAAAATAVTADGINFINHANNNSMQPPKPIMITPSPRKRNRTNAASSTIPINSENLEILYLEEVKKKNVLLVEQGEINRKRLRLEEKKVKLMEEFFPKFMNLQQDILKKLETVGNETPTAINIKLED